MPKIAALAFCIALFASAQQSRPPAPGPPVVGQNQKSKRTPEQPKAQSGQSRADSISASIDKLTTEVTAWKDQSKAPPEKGDASADWILAFATLLIAVLTFFQWLILKAHHKVMDRQANYIRDALAETKKSSDAAVSAAEVAKRSLEVAYQAKVGITSIVLRDPVPEARSMDNDATLSNCCIEMSLINTGPTVARSFTFTYLIDIFGLEGIINPPVAITYGPTELHPNVTFERESLPIHLIFPDANVLWGYAIEGRNITVSGDFSYWDIFGNRFTVDYFARIRPPANLDFVQEIEIPFEVNTESNAQG